MKIAIIGCPGSGKSTFAAQLHQALGIPLYHLDRYFWLPGWQEPVRDVYHKKHNALCDKDSWIIEGVSTGCFAYRAQKADIIIFLDLPLHICLYRVFKRAFIYYGTVQPFGAVDCKEKFPSYKFLKFILFFNKTRRPLIKALCATHMPNKKIFYIRNNDEQQYVINTLKKLSDKIN